MLVGLALVNPGLTRTAAGLQATGQGSVGTMTLISALTNNMDMPTTNTKGVQLPPTSSIQLVQQYSGVAVVPTAVAPPKGAVVANCWQ